MVLWDLFYNIYEFEVKYGTINTLKIAKCKGLHFDHFINAQGQNGQY